MLITFRIHYLTRWGEELFVKLSDSFTSLKMDYAGDGWWCHTLNVADNLRGLRYTYQVRDNGLPSRDEPVGACHTLVAQGGVEHYLVIDRWIDSPDYSPSRPATLTAAFFERGERARPQPLHTGDVRLVVRMRGVTPAHAVAVVGAGPQLGDWNPARATILDNECGDTWSLVLHHAVGQVLEFKLLVVGREDHTLLAWERGDNHRVDTGGTRATVAVVNTLVVDNPLRARPEVGTRIDLALLRSERDMGCGDFKDLVKFISWQAKTGQSCLLLAPLNDTSVAGSWYTFKAVNTFSLHPAYLAVDAVGDLHDKELAARYHQRAVALNRRKTVDRDDVAMLKLQMLADIFMQQAGAIMAQRDFKRFVASNIAWLKPYAAFVMLRQVKGSPDVSAWGDFARYDEDRVTRFLDARAVQAHFVYFVQYQLLRQLHEAYDHAARHGIVIGFDHGEEAVQGTVVDLSSWLAAVPRLAQPERALAGGHRFVAGLEAITASTDLNRGVKALVAQLIASQPTL